MLYTILLVIFVVILFGGVGPWSPGGYGYGFGHVGIGVPGILIVILLVLLLMGR